MGINAWDFCTVVLEQPPKNKARVFLSFTMKMKIVKMTRIPCLVLLLLLMESCGTTQTSYQREYARVWNEMIKSKAWQESLLAQQSNTFEDLYASADEGLVLDDSPKFDSGFEDKYQSLVSRAYFKIITEAEKADARISAEYQLLQQEDISNKQNRKKVAEITQKYEAHKAMLYGLKSWNIFSENRTGDLEYFKAENKLAVQKMMSTGENDSQMVNYLIYKLADLYHVEDN